jgi:DNA-binding response OmpR family regulator
MKRILIVEDDSRIVAALEIRLTAAGYSVSHGRDVTSGLSKAIQEQPDLILLDISLPGGDGLELAQTLKNRSETRRIPIVFVTASKDPDLRIKAMELGAAGLFEKPYDAEELLAVTGHALGETGTFRKPLARFAGEPAPALAGGRRILIVEDDQRIALALSLRLKSAGYDVASAEDALNGVNTALRFQPDLVLLDISMPAGDGFTVAERLKKLLPRATPVIFLTASKQPGFRQRAAELGAVGYFEKPYEAESLLAAVQQQVQPISVQE